MKQCLPSLMGCFHCLDCCLDSGVKHSGVVTKLKKVQISKRHILSSVLLKSGYSMGWEFSHTQNFCKNGMKSFLRNLSSTSYVSLSNTFITHNHILDFSCYFESDHSDRSSISGSSSRLSLPSLNSSIYLCT